MKAVIFDVGRVLVHWNRAAFLESLAEISQVDSERLNALLIAVYHAFSVGALDGVALHRYLMDHAGLTADYDRFYHACCRPLARNDTGLSVAKRLRQEGVKVGIISNTNAIHASWLWQNVPEFAEFDTVTLSSEVGLVKPDPAIFRLTLERLGVAPAAALFIDDIPEFVASAQGLGMAGVVHQNWVATQQAIDVWLAANAAAET